MPVNNEDSRSNFSPTEIFPESKSSLIKPMSSISRSGENILDALQKNDISVIVDLHISPLDISEFREAQATCFSVFRVYTSCVFYLWKCTCMLS